MATNCVDIDKSLIVDWIDHKKWQELAEYLRKKFVVTNNRAGRPNSISVPESVIDTLSYTLNCLGQIGRDNLNADLLAVMKEVFRSLRNSVAFSAETQTLTGKDTFILQDTFNILNELLNSTISNKDECTKLLLQFLNNLVTNNLDNAMAVWKLFEEPIVKFIRIPIHSYHATALFYNIIYLNKIMIKDCYHIYDCTLDIIALGDRNLYHTFILEIFIEDCNFSKRYEILETSRKITLLQTLAEFVENVDEYFDISSQAVQELAALFKAKSDCVLKTVSSYVDNIEPQEVVLLLEVLAALSADEKHSKPLHDDKGLITNCAFMLQSIHTLGKQSQNHFTPIQKLSEVASTNNEARTNPVFGFKADLVRFLGNVCWKNKENQDKLRELECIPLLLDCCNIDARNPFIIQWAILAIRNVCDNNETNQAVIAGLTKRGVVNSSTLQEMGLTLHDDGANKIVLGPLPDDK